MLQVLGWMALGVLGIGVLVLVVAALPLWSKETPSEAADTIEHFLAGRLADHEWDAFTCIRPRDPIVQSAKQRVREIEERHSCSTLDEAGESALREVAESLRESAA